MDRIENPTFQQKLVDVEQVVQFFHQLPDDFKQAVERAIQASPEWATEAETEAAAVQDVGEDFLTEEEITYYLSLPDDDASR